MSAGSNKLTASISLDLDNLWTYMKVHGDPDWQKYPSYLEKAVPVILDFLAKHDQKLTFFVVGRDALREENHASLRMIADAGHEIANHSFNHEPWMQSYSEDKVAEELEEAERAIVAATGYKPKGFRGPGYANSASIIGALQRLGYEYDASLLPSILGPLARFYYFWGAKLSRDDKQTRGDLFGHFSDGFRPLKPFDWNVPNGKVLEIPVTTIPVFRTPFHLSYLIWLSRFSTPLALTYMRFATTMCRLRGVEPSYLLHPLDFIGKEEAPQLAFFPGMDLPRESKLEFASKFFRHYQECFDVVPMAEHFRRIRAAGGLRSVKPVLSQS